MSDSDKKLKASIFKNAQSRIFFVIGLIVVVGIAIGGYFYYRSQSELNVGAASVSGAPSIQSTPGAGDPSAEYTQAQTQANISGELEARKKATSFVPTIIRPQFEGDASQFDTPTATSQTADPKAMCETKKVVMTYNPNPESCLPKNLALARTTGVTAEELMCQGCSCPALKVAGYTAGDLKKIGLTAEQLRQCGYSLQALMRAGFNAADLRKAGFSAADLAKAGFSPSELAKAGFSPDQLAKAFSQTALQNAGLDKGSHDCDVANLKKERAAGVSAETLAKDGCGATALKAAGFTPSEIKAAENALKNCSVAELEKERAQGISATALKQKGCGLAALKAAGFSASALRQAGFSPAQLEKAGFTANQLKDAGLSAPDLKNAGFAASQLKNAGYSDQQLKNAGFSAGRLAGAGADATALKNAGFSANALRDAGFSALQLKDAGFSVPALRNSGFTNGDLLRAGFSPEAAGYAAAVPKEQEPQVAAKPVATPAPTQAPIDDQPYKVGKDATLPDIEQNTMQGKLAQFQAQEQKEMDAQERSNRVQQTQGLMMGQAQNFMTGWSNFSTQHMQLAPKPQKDADASSGDAAAGANANGNAQEKTGPIIKAGTVLFAVLDTAINSDEKSPIMAHVVAGKLKGSRLLGDFTRVDKRVLIRFNLLSNPAYDKSIPLNAVAIDSNTARTAISGEVNNHYLLRYGTLFAASFLEGVSNGIINNGVSTDCAAGGGLFCIVKTSPLNTDQQIAVGLGKVGQAYAEHMGQNFNLPPTIRVAAGSGVGVLIMSDLTLPTQMDSVMHQ